MHVILVRVQWHVALQTCVMGLQMSSLTKAGSPLLPRLDHRSQGGEDIVPDARHRGIFSRRIVFRLGKCSNQSRPGFWQAGKTHAKYRKGPQRSALRVCISVLPTEIVLRILPIIASEYVT